jgi:hypothetical protein
MEPAAAKPATPGEISTSSFRGWFFQTFRGQMLGMLAGA